MGIVARCCDHVIVSEEGRLALSGPEVIETVEGCGGVRFARPRAGVAHDRRQASLSTRRSGHAGCGFDSRLSRGRARGTRRWPTIDAGGARSAAGETRGTSHAVRRARRRSRYLERTGHRRSRAICRCWKPTSFLSPSGKGDTNEARRTARALVSTRAQRIRRRSGRAWDRAKRPRAT